MLQPMPEIIVTDHETCGMVLATGDAYDDKYPGGWDVWEASVKRSVSLLLSLKKKRKAS